MGYDPTSPSESPKGQQDIRDAQQNRVQQLAKLKPKKALEGLEKKINVRVEGKIRLIGLRVYQKELVVFAAVRKYISSSEYIEAVNALVRYQAYLTDTSVVHSLLMECAAHFGKKTTGQAIKNAASNLSSKIGNVKVVQVHTRVDAHQATLDRYQER